MVDLILGTKTILLSMSNYVSTLSSTSIYSWLITMLIIGVNPDGEGGSEGSDRPCGRKVELVWTVEILYSMGEKDDREKDEGWRHLRFSDVTANISWAVLK